MGIEGFLARCFGKHEFGHRVLEIVTWDGCIPLTSALFLDIVRNIFYCIQIVSCLHIVSPCAQDSHNAAIEMHNTLIKNVASMERTLLKTISVAKLIF
jgi:hypothetical protein